MRVARQLGNRRRHDQIGREKRRLAAERRPMVITTTIPERHTVGGQALHGDRVLLERDLG